MGVTQGGAGGAQGADLGVRRRVVLGLAGAWCTQQWLRRGPGPAAGLLAGYLAAFGLSHPLAKKIGAWRSVFAVTGAFGAATYAVTSRTSEN